MEELLRAFRRNEDGTWTCVHHVTLEGPQGRIEVVQGAVFQPGRLHRGLDVARFLEARLRHPAAGRSSA